VQRPTEAVYLTSLCGVVQFGFRRGGAIRSTFARDLSVSMIRDYQCIPNFFLRLRARNYATLQAYYSARLSAMTTRWYLAVEKI